MEFANCTRNEYGKCDVPENTIKRIKDGLRQVGVRVDWGRRYQVSERIFWVGLYSSSLGMSAVGKGVSPQLAEASAYAEFVERLSYPTHWNTLHYNSVCTAIGKRFQSYEWVEGYVKCVQDELENPLGIEDLLASQAFLTSEDFECIKGSEAAQHWVDGYSLGRQERVKVPITFVGSINGSNGLAAGNTLAEAVVQASCEVFERYAEIHVIKPEAVIPTVDLDSVIGLGSRRARMIADMVDVYGENDIDVLIKDMSFDGLLPCIGVLFVNRGLPPNHIEYRILQPAASFDLEEALTRCFTERMQGRMNFGCSPESVDRVVVDEVSNYELLLRARISEKDISLVEDGEVRSFRNSYQADDLFEELEEIKGICQKLDTDCIVVDLTHPVLRFPVVRVIMPKVSDVISYHIPEPRGRFVERPGQKQGEIMETFFRA